MNRKKGTCKCPPHLQKYCKHSRNKRVEPIAVKDVIEALAYEDIERKSNKPKTLIIPTNFKTKPFKPRHYKDTCVPMKPSMHTRLRYIQHCPIEETQVNDSPRNIFMSRDFGSSSDEDVLVSRQSKYKKRVRYYDVMPGAIYLSTPAPVVKHTDSDKFIVNLPSPKTSGEVIRAQEAKVKPTMWKPPLPAKSGHDLFKPHSGIVINQDSSYVPDVVHVPGKLPMQTPQKMKRCHKKGVCKNKSCPNKKCRKFNAKRRRELRRSTGIIKRGGIRFRSRSVASGATDGTPRARGQLRHVTDKDSNCGLDEIPRPQHAFIPPNLKKGTLETHSLTLLPCTKEQSPIHYGILKGSFNMYDSKFGARSRGRQALTMSVMAYCLAFHYHPKQWTAKLVDNLVDSGDSWYLQCLEKVHDHSAIQGICEVLPYGKKQTLVLNHKKMQVLLGEPDVIGYTMSKDPTVYNLCRGLTAFFKDHRAGILLTRVLKVVIWKDKVCYYIFDPAGRDSRAYSNYANGTAALINVVDVKSVAEVLLSRSILEDQKYVLASLKVLRMVKETADEDFESEEELTQAERAMLGFKIMNESCAIVNANMHLGERCFEEAKYRQAVPIAVVAMTYAKISPPNTWFSKTLDKILRLGNKLYHDCVHPKVLIDLTIDNIPNIITLGPYSCEIIIYRDRVKGQLFTPKECIFNIRSGLIDFFNHEHNSGILEFNNYYMAVWRQKEMFYLFDPYPRTVDGQRSFKSGRACCWMFLNPESMAQALIKNWNYMPATTQFYIHAFKVLKLKKKQPKNALVCTLSDENIPKKKKSRRSVLHAAKSRGDNREVVHDVMPSVSSVSVMKNRTKAAAEPKMDEEQMGDIVSLVDSIQDDDVPAIPLKYKNMPPEPFEEKIVNLDSPTVSVTQVVPPWPMPRDKSNEQPEPDPSPEPTPPPTPPPPPVTILMAQLVPAVNLDSPTVSVTQVVPPWPMPRDKSNEQPEPDPSPEPTPPPTPPPPPVTILMAQLVPAVNLDSPTVSVTQVVPPWPMPRDKSNEQPEPDPSPEPTPPPTPPPPPVTILMAQLVPAVNLDSPTVSVTQVVPPWPMPRDKSNEQPEPDPSPEPTPPPTPPPPPVTILMAQLVPAVNLDSPTVSVTQVVPPWPMPRDKSNEQPEPDPSPEPTPPPTPPPPPVTILMAQLVPAVNLDSPTVSVTQVVPPWPMPRDKSNEQPEPDPSPEPTPPPTPPPPPVTILMAQLVPAVNLDSPTVSVTQVVPPWPMPRDKSNEQPEPDPSPEPTPPPTPPPPPVTILMAQLVPAVNLDSPTVSVTQVVPPWPMPRDKSNEQPEPDPSPEPTPPPTPPPPPVTILMAQLVPAVNLDSPTVSVTQVVPPWPMPRDKSNEQPEPDPSPEPTPPPTPPPPPVTILMAQLVPAVNLDSPTVSVTQVVPPWPMPRDKSNEQPEPDPSPEPTPPPTPPPPPIPEGGVEEEEPPVEEEEDEEQKKERIARQKAEEEEARRKAEELPPPLPPPPSPQPEPAEELHPLEIPLTDPVEVEAAPPAGVDRQVLLPADAKRRFKLRALRRHMTTPLTDADLPLTPSQELEQPTNFKSLPDNTEIIRGSSGIPDKTALPFAAIIAVVTSYKYLINSWTKGIVDFTVAAGQQLYKSKKELFQTAPVHVIPKIGIGKQAYHAIIDVVGEGATWEMEDVLNRKVFPKHDRGIITTSTYSCAFFARNGLYYLYDASPCNAMGIRDDKAKGGAACFMRFRSLHDLIARIMYNKDGTTEDQQFIVSNILVRRLLTQPRYQLPEDYDYEKMAPKSQKSKPTLVPEPKGDKKPKTTDIALEEPKSKTKVGYSLCDGVYRIEGTTALKDRSGSSNVKSCHFVSLMAMLMATMHPIRTWDHTMVDTSIEKGLEIFAKATNLTPCEKRVIKNVIVDGKFININIKKIIVINNNPEKSLEQYLSAVARRLRYFLIQFPQCTMVVCHSDGYYHLFDPYESPKEAADESTSKTKHETKPCGPYASWTLYRSQEALVNRLRKTIAGSTVDAPSFFTFELTSIKTAPRHSALNYRLSPLFKPDENPNSPYLNRRRTRPLVDEKMYWLNIELIPWSRMNSTNDLGFPRKTPRSLWKEWDIEFPGDLYSLWGSVHPLDAKFDEKNRGKQYLATCVVAIVMTQSCQLSAWTGSFLDGIVNAGDKYHEKSLQKIGGKENHELTVADLDEKFDMYPYSFTAKFENIIFGFVYNMLPDRFNLSKALDYFFETHSLGLLVSPSKNLAFGRAGKSYFMFDCQSYGVPIFCPKQGAAYMLKCESLNRLVYCITLTLNIRRHGTQFHLFSVNMTLTENTK